MIRWNFDEQQQIGELTVSGAVTVGQVVELKGELLKAIEQVPLVRIDLGNVEQIDIAGVQLFCAAYRLAARSGKVLTVTRVGEPVLKLVRSAGFAHASVCDQGRHSACLWAQR